MIALVILILAGAFASGYISRGIVDRAARSWSMPPASRRAILRDRRRARLGLAAPNIGRTESPQHRDEPTRGRLPPDLEIELQACYPWLNGADVCGKPRPPWWRPCARRRWERTVDFARRLHAESATRHGVLVGPPTHVATVRDPLEGRLTDAIGKLGDHYQPPAVCSRCGLYNARVCITCTAKERARG